MTDLISVWAAFDADSGAYYVSLEPAEPCTEVQMSRRQYDALREAADRYTEAQQFVKRALGLKDWSGGTMQDPQVDDSRWPL